MSAGEIACGAWPSVSSIHESPSLPWQLLLIFTPPNTHFLSKAAFGTAGWASTSYYWAKSDQETCLTPQHLPEWQAERVTHTAPASVVQLKLAQQLTHHQPWLLLFHFHHCNGKNDLLLPTPPHPESAL